MAIVLEGLSGVSCDCVCSDASAGHLSDVLLRSYTTPNLPPVSSSTSVVSSVNVLGQSCYCLLYWACAACAHGSNACANGRKSNLNLRSREMEALMMSRSECKIRRQCCRYPDIPAAELALQEYLYHQQCRADLYCAPSVTDFVFGVKARPVKK